MIENKEMSIGSIAAAGDSKKESTKKSFFHIDREMIRFKAHFFLSIGAMGVALPYLPIVARNRIGLSATSLAAVLTTQQLLAVITKPVIGYVADYFNKLKLIIITLLTVQAIALFLVIAVPPIHKSTTIDFGGDEFTMIIARPSLNVEFICVSSANATALCFKNKNSPEVYGTELNCSCSVATPVPLENVTDTHERWGTLKSVPLDQGETFPCMISRNNNGEGVSDFATLEFWMFAITTTLMSTCVSSVFTLGDTACFETVEKVKGDFGRQRMFGAVGWGTMSAIGGLLIDLTHDYVAAWVLMAVLKIITIWNISQLDLVKPHFSQNLLKDVGKVLKSLEFVAFEWGVFFNGLGAGIMWFYLLWFLAGLGANTFLCGLVNYVQCFLGEIPFMYFSGWFIQKLGHFNLITLSLLSYALRFLWYSYLYNPWLVLPMEIAHAFTYGTFYPTVASYGKKSAKPGTEATTQSILFTTHEGLGAGLGCILAGIGFDLVGSHQTFFYVSLMGFCAAIFNAVNTYLLNRRSSEVLTLSQVNVITPE
ncbi:major facilitator superfamily domain-containing protein 6-like [Parasteatoda tepidariorum]|uniref:major facilitator superfamily domain-containing protein 6-like n=1 Tax=Parasteatoda tepidariorum TaxID=114398 RepID=UPI00077FABC7|nr:major facilitator superfamily domain-containing protein 6-like [Parasteatoda tepidariorum]